MACLNSPVHKTVPIILASQSLVRRAMLQERGLDFSVVASPYDEEAQKEHISLLSPVQQALFLAHGKAYAVSVAYPDAYVIGADQICAYGQRILDKPIDSERAQKHLSMLQGKVHHQHSAACIFRAGVHMWSGIETVELHMHELTEAQIVQYIACDEPFSACGAYCYEKTGHKLFSYVNGSAEAIKGLPIDSLWLELLRLRGAPR